MASKKSKNTGLIVTLLLASVAGGVLMGAYVIDTPGALHVSQDMRAAKPGASRKSTQVPQRLVPHVSKGGDLTFEPQDIKVPAGQDARLYLVNDYLKQLHDTGLGDKNAKAIGIDVRNGVAHLQFTRSFDETYGTMDEGNVLTGIERVLGQFSDIEKIQFEIDGQSMQTTGNIDLTEPQPVIRPGDPVPSSGDAG